MAASLMAETAGVAVRCRTLRAVNAPGTLAWERQRRTRRSARYGPRRVSTARLRSPLVAS
jgi:hypothetical protein